MWSVVLLNYGIDASKKLNKQADNDSLYNWLFAGLDEIIEIEDIRNNK
jgi:hypothetical protein